MLLTRIKSESDHSCTIVDRIISRRPLDLFFVPRIKGDQWMVYDDLIARGSLEKQRDVVTNTGSEIKLVNRKLSQMLDDQ